jgi:hypothetical protein
VQQQPQIYDAVMGEAMNRLAPPIRDFHRAANPAHFAGRASVKRGGNPLARIAAAIIGLPATSPDCPVEIEITRNSQATEIWRRTFAGKPFISRQYAGTGTWSGLMIERIGPMSFAYALIERKSDLHLDVRYWSAFGIPMPAFLGPKADAFEHAANNRFNFDVAMSLPIIGLLVHYRGWLEPVS